MGSILQNWHTKAPDMRSLGLFTLSLASAKYLDNSNGCQPNSSLPYSNWVKADDNLFYSVFKEPIANVNQDGALQHCKSFGGGYGLATFRSNFEALSFQSLHEYL